MVSSTARPASRPPFPPFTAETAKIKVKAAQDLWNTRSVIISWGGVPRVFSFFGERWFARLEADAKFTETPYLSRMVIQRSRSGVTGAHS